jgi:hypothetical protein
VRQPRTRRVLDSQRATLFARVLRTTLGSMEEVRSHYPVRFRLDGVERLMIWYCDERDGVLLSVSDRNRTLRF